MNKYVSKLTENIIPYDTKRKYYVYALWFEGDIVYVGQTIHLKSRITVHSRNKRFDGYSFFECKNKTGMDLIETNLIIKLSPKYNATKTRGHETLFTLRERFRSINDFYRYSPKFYVRELRHKIKELGVDITEIDGEDCIQTKDVPIIMMHLVGDLCE